MRTARSLMTLLLMLAIVMGSIGSAGAAPCGRPQSNSISFNPIGISGRHGGLPLQFNEPFGSQALGVRLPDFKTPAHAKLVHDFHALAPQDVAQPIQKRLLEVIAARRWLLQTALARLGLKRNAIVALYTHGTILQEDVPAFKKHLGMIRLEREEKNRPYYTHAIQQLLENAGQIGERSSRPAMDVFGNALAQTTVHPPSKMTPSIINGTHRLRTESLQQLSVILRAEGETLGLALAPIDVSQIEEKRAGDHQAPRGTAIKHELIQFFVQTVSPPSIANLKPVLRQWCRDNGLPRRHIHLQNSLAGARKLQRRWFDGMNFRDMDFQWKVLSRGDQTYEIADDNFILQEEDQVRVASRRNAGAIGTIYMLDLDDFVPPTRKRTGYVKGTYWRMDDHNEFQVFKIPAYNGPSKATLLRLIARLRAALEAAERNKRHVLDILEAWIEGYRGKTVLLAPHPDIGGLTMPVQDGQELRPFIGFLKPLAKDDIVRLHEVLESALLSEAIPEEVVIRAISEEGVAWLGRLLKKADRRSNGFADRHLYAHYLTRVFTRDTFPNLDRQATQRIKAAFIAVRRAA